MELMFAEWEDGERFSFEDSDRFEEDSLCSFISEAESLCQNWRGWRKQSAGPNSPTVRNKGRTSGTSGPRHQHLLIRLTFPSKGLSEGLNPEQGLFSDPDLRRFRLMKSWKMILEFQSC